MSYLILLLIAIFPGIGLLYYVKKKDLHQPEPWRIIWVTFFLSCLLLFGAVIVEVILTKAVNYNEKTASVIMHAFFAFFVVSLTEEFFKWLPIRIYAYRKKDFDEVIDGLVYGAASGAGFATLENIMYVLQGGLGTGVMRAFMAVPLHIFTGGLLGYGLAQLKLNRKTGLHWLMFALAVACHGGYDAVLFMAPNHIGIIAMPAALSVVIFLLILKKKLLKETSEISKQQMLAIQAQKSLETGEASLSVMSSETIVQSIQPKRTLFKKFTYIFIGGILTLFGLIMGIGSLSEPFKLEELYIYLILIPLPLVLGAVLFLKSRKI